MCGIFGFVLRPETALASAEATALLHDLIRLSESRGKEAAGLALRSDTELHVCKEASRGTAFVKGETFRHLTSTMLSAEALARSPLAVIGHTRLVTNGSMERHENNQPVIRGNAVGIHNGIIVNDAALFAGHGLAPTCEVDTEALLAVVEHLRGQGKTLPAAVAAAFAELRGTASIALLFRDVPALLLSTNNGSLYALNGEHAFVFASEHYILQELLKQHGEALGASAQDIVHVEPGTGMVLTLAAGEPRPFRFGEEPTAPPAVPAVILKDWPSQSPAQATGIRNVFSEEDLVRFAQVHRERSARIAGLRRCSRCILPETMPFIAFDAQGVCNFCNHHVPATHKGEEALLAEVEKHRGDGSRPDCLFPLSGGRDSSYGLHYVKNVLKLHPIAYSYDWGMLTDLGRRNQARMCGALGVEHLLISADIGRKRRYIRQNVLAWLRRPDLGTVPLFMAGDKQYFYYLNRLKKQISTDLAVYCENPLEQTNFKYGFCGVPPKFDREHVYDIGIRKKLTMAFYYAGHYARNPRLLNTSLMDTAGAFLSTYFLPHEYIYLYRFIPWEEETINRTLIDEYDWELADDTTTTWRIGDGTAAFYNYIYYAGAGFTENDTFRSNQIREGLLTREEGLKLAERENAPRFPSLAWYGDTIGIDIKHALDVIDAMPKRY